MKGTINISATYKSGTYKDRYWYTNQYSGAGQDVYVYLKEAEIGGICANAKSSIFSNCKTVCNITWNAISEKSTLDSSCTYELLSNNSSIGGIVGYATDCEIKSSLVSGKLNVRFINQTSRYWDWAYQNVGFSSQAGNNKCGGIVGYADNCVVKNTLFSGIIQSEGGSSWGIASQTMLGGFIGYSNTTTIKCSYYNGNFVNLGLGALKYGSICGSGYLTADQCFSISNAVMFKSTGSVTKCYTTSNSDATSDISNVDVTLLSLKSWYAINLPDWDFENVWYIPTEENGLPLLSLDPKISYEGDFRYGGLVTFSSQNIHKGIVLEPKNPEEVEIANNRVRFNKAGEIFLTIRQEAYGEYRKIKRDLLFNVDKVGLTISIEPSSSIYGDDIPEFKLKYEGFILNDNASSLNSLPKLLCDASPFHNVGDYPIIMQGGDADNYNISCSNGLHTILPRSLNATPQDCARKYGSNNPTFRIIYDGFVNEDNENIISISPNIQTSADKYSDVGSYTILCNGGTVSSNYILKYGVGTLNIEKSNLNITVLDAKRNEGEPNPKFEMVFDGFKNNDNVFALDELPVITCEANIASPAGIYPIKLTGGQDNNYEYILNEGLLTIEEMPKVILVNNITLNSNLWEAHPGDKFQLVANIQPDNATTKELTWKSNNETVASVDMNGVVSAHNEGDCIITVSSTDGSNTSNQCNVFVSSKNDSLLELATEDKSEVFNIQGILLMRGASKEDISRLQPGIYIILTGNIYRKIKI